MHISGKQRTILKHLQDNRQISKKEAVELLKHYYYYNASKHVGDILTRMVRKGILKRVRRGVYERGNGMKKTKQINNPNQLKLF